MPAFDIDVNLFIFQKSINHASTSISFCYCTLQKSIEEKIEAIAKEIYGADGIEVLPTAQEQIDRYKKQVCKRKQIFNYRINIDEMLLVFEYCLCTIAITLHPWCVYKHFTY